MEFRFDPAQEFQLDAIAAAADLFEGQPYLPSELVIPESGSFAVVANRLDLSEEDLLRNLRSVQEKRNLNPDAGLQFIEERIEGLTGEELVRFPNFSVEMETGTGKTYVYLRTALELYRRYGLRKFIIVVPSIAVKEGVVKTLEVTRQASRRSLRQSALSLLRLRFEPAGAGAAVHALRRGGTDGDDARLL